MPLILCLAASVIAQPSEGAPLGAAVHLPSIYFVDANSKADFLTNVEKALTEAAGRRITATLVEAEQLNAPIWLVDAPMAALEGKLVYVLRAHKKGATSLPVAVYGSKPLSKLGDFLDDPFAASGKHSALLRAIRFWLLLDEPVASNVTKNARFARDARSALLAVAAGTQPTALAWRIDYQRLDPQMGALKEVGWLREMPLPILAINSAVLSAADVKALRSTLNSAKLPPIPGLVDGWKGGDFDDVGQLVASIQRNTSAVNRTAVLSPLPAPRVSLAPLLPQPPSAPELGADLVMPGPQYRALPEPPESAAPKPVASRSDSAAR